MSTENNQYRLVQFKELPTLEHAGLYAIIDTSDNKFVDLEELEEAATIVTYYESSDNMRFCCSIDKRKVQSILMSLKQVDEGIANYKIID